MLPALPTTTKDSCVYRRGKELSHACKELRDYINQQVSFVEGQLPVKNFTDPVCTHPDGPFVMFGGAKDEYLCDFCIKENLCPLGIKV
jgi:hypothetical protein